MPKSLRCKIKKLCYNGALTEKDRDRILKALDQEPMGAKETIIKSALKYLVKMQIEEGSVGFAVDNDHDHDCRWDDVLAWLEAQTFINKPCISEGICREDKMQVLDKIRAETKEWYWQADKQALSKDPCVVDAMVDLFIRTIDKYKSESEE